MKSEYLSAAEALMQTPTAPFHEQWMCEVIDRLLADIPGLDISVDRFGNRYARLARGESRGNPVVFIAHLDHPGFSFENGLVPVNGHSLRYECQFEGRVQDRFFPGAAVRLFRAADDAGVAARIVEASSERPETTGNRAVVLETDQPADGAVLGMWDLPAMYRQGDLIHSRACDDLAGCAAMIETLRRLAGSSAPRVDVTMVFTRAEEAGFCGLLCLLGESPLPEPLSPDGLYLSVETSGEAGAIAVGDGAIIRCGDRSTTFDGAIVDTLFGLTNANGVRARRALMDKGTCEATAAARAGLRAGGICIPVRNYHNMDMAAGVIAPEAVSLSDAEALVEMIRMFVTACGEGHEPKSVILHDYEKYLRKGLGRLVPVPLVSQTV